MIHTVHLDDAYIDVKNLLKEMRYYKQGVRFESPIDCNVIPEGYMTVEQFRLEAKKSLTNILNEHGIY
jgi:hypothetical protein